MEEHKIRRINELYKKHKAGTISEEEAAERKALHREYVNEVKENLKRTLDNAKIKYPDGTMEDVKDRRKDRKSGG